MSARANLWKETGDIIGGIFAYISIILVIAIMPTVGIFIGFLEKTNLEEEFFKNNFEQFYLGVRTHFWQSRIYNLIYILKRIIFVSIAFFLSDPSV